MTYLNTWTDYTLAQFVIYVNKDIHQHDREIYGPLDFLGDVGGLSDALLAIGGWLITFS